MPIQAGRLREQIEILSPVRVPNDSGGSVTEYVSKMVTRAEQVEERSVPDVIANQEDIVNTVRFRFRYRRNVDIVNGDKMIWRQRDFIINNAKVDPNRTVIEILCVLEMDNSNRDFE